ncbi:hypothetical protein D9615_004366 [Tricholomella constricta]|uniref:DUF155 domain-containing protein n=1 Tax=Tricholomella constricta TaxID=117010 RepID=A0A8H5M691_9AGAR|nr:hypothetical protein D9615_004366 [Tricholomella constricta]
MLNLFQSSLARSFQRPIFCRTFSNRYLAAVHQRSLTSAAIPDRGYPADDFSEPPKAKPKATTPLRRSASESLPIRVTRTPTRGDIQTVFTLTTAERYLLSRLRFHPDLPPRAQALNESWWIPKWGHPGSEGEVFVFSNGSIVCWGLGEQDARRFAAEVIDSVPGIKIEALAEAETEELEFVVDPIELGDADDLNTRLQGDLIILGQMSPLSSSQSLPTNLPPMVFPEDTLLVRYAYSQALSRSTALSALEVSLDEYLTSMAQLPHSLVNTGKPGMGRTALIKKLGELMKFRQGLNLNRENFSDVPDFYWSEPELERKPYFPMISYSILSDYSGHFNSMSGALDVKERTMSVNDKITYAAEAQSVLRQLLTESSTHSMELVIIALIAVEVVIALIRDGPELWSMLVGEDVDKKHGNIQDKLALS